MLLKDSWPKNSGQAGWVCMQGMMYFVILHWRIDLLHRSSAVFGEWSRATSSAGELIEDSIHGYSPSNSSFKKTQGLSSPCLVRFNASNKK